MSRRAAGAGGNAGAGTAAGAGGAGAGSKQAAAVKKTEYMGPDGDLVANLERDVLDRSPGIRWVGWQARWLLLADAKTVGSSKDGHLGANVVDRHKLARHYLLD
jgi:hypothetical protein